MIYSGPSSNFVDLTFVTIPADSAFHPHVMFDQMDHYLESANTSGLEFWARETRSYLADGSIGGMVMEYVGAMRNSDGWRQTIAYENGKPVKVYNLQVYPLRADTVGIRTLRYDAGNQLIFDSVAKRGTFVFSPVVVRQYSYDASGRMASVKIDYRNTNDENRYYNYDADGRVKSVYTYEPDQYRPEELRQIDSFEYQPGVYGYTRYLLMKFYGVNRWMYEKRESVVSSLYNGYLRDSMTTIITDENGKVTDSSAARFFYNSNDLPDSNHHYTRFYGVYKKFAWNIYQYEQYNNGVDVPEVRKQAVRLLAVPNPSRGRVSFRVPAGFDGQAATILVMDVSGRPVYSESLRLTGGQHAFTLDDRLPAGQYLLTLRDERGDLIGTSKISRL